VGAALWVFVLSQDRERREKRKERRHYRQKKFSTEEEMELEHSLLKVPYELLAKELRQSQKLIDKELQQTTQVRCV